MPHIEAFRGVRYDLGRVGSLSNVVAPPYDVIDTELNQKLQAKHPFNAVRLILPEDAVGDQPLGEGPAGGGPLGNGASVNRYTRAARRFRQWRRDGVLFDEGDPAVYVCHQTYAAGGATYTRRGFMCRVRLSRFGEGLVHPHEETHGGAKADRLNLWRACRANLSQIFGLYPDAENTAPALLDAAIAGATPLEATDHLGVVNRLWPVTDVETIARLQALVGPKPLYIADGHHRYETACDYRDEVAEAHGGELPPDHPANFVLAMAVSMSDPGMIVQPTHRLFRGLPEMNAATLTQRLGAAFTTEPVGRGPEAAPAVWELIELEDEQQSLALYTAGDNQWTMCRLTAAGSRAMAAAAADKSDDWRGLGVSLLHRLVVHQLLGYDGGEAPKYVRSIEEVVDGLEHGEAAGRDLTGQLATGGRFNLAALVMPASLDDVRAVSDRGERMPAKSTYFYPKVLSGLVFNPLE
ncbi:MAG: DUF1015 domain-containing protein [Planctomycetota bacterium]